jgi:hypothetical protein
LSQVAIGALADLLIIAGAIAALLAALRRYRPAAMLNAALAAVFIALDLIALLAWARDSSAYLSSNGSVPHSDLVFLACSVALALASFAFACVAYWKASPIVWIAWLANVPHIAIYAYLAFWFHVF